MAASSSELTAAADVLIEHSKEEPTFSTENSKELIVTTATEGMEVQSGNSDGLHHTKVQKEAESTSPEVSPENGTPTTTEEESVSGLLRHMKTEKGQDGDPGKSLDQVLREVLEKEKKYINFIFKRTSLRFLKWVLKQHQCDHLFVWI